MQAVTQADALFFKQQGYLIIRNPLSSAQRKELIESCNDIKLNYGDVPGKWMNYMEIDSAGERVLSRVENFVNYHRGLNDLLRGSALLSILSELGGEPYLLMKEKINYKLPRAGGFSPHIDAVAYVAVAATSHLTISMAIEPATLSNGCLEVVARSHLAPIPMGEDRCLTQEWCERQTWIPVELETGDFLVFGSHLAHRSGANESDEGRALIYATYSAAAHGDLHDAYYVDRRKKWPPTFERIAGVDYSEGSALYGYGSPMLTIQ